MDSAWDRIERELARRKKGLQWLADQMTYTLQRVQNWKTRGVPKSAYPDVAAAFGESIDWVAGVAEPKWRGGGVPAEHWRAVADEVATQLDAQGALVQARVFLETVDLMAEAIQPDTQPEERAATVTRHLRLIARR
jgi:hypothetical protein